MSDEGRLATFLSYQWARVSWKTLQRIETHFKSLHSALEQPESAWQQANLLTETQRSRLFSDDCRRHVDASLRWQSEPHQHCLTPFDKAYPALLNTIDDRPILLSLLGDASVVSDPQLAIVGSRNASRYGKDVAQNMAEYLAKVGLTITSGLASGIDKAAHEGALKSQQTASTVAVVATGLDRVYPASHRDLAHRIAENGAIVSEYPLGTKPLAYHFPERNRIISGLSVGTLVVEAAQQSGSLITARLAMEQGREVFAVPGSVHSPHSKGCHELIRQGAKLVESADHILEDLKPLLEFSMTAVSDETEQTPMAGKDSALLQWLDFEPMSLDELVVLSKWPVSALQSELLMLELEGRIESLSAGRYRRLR